MQKNTAIWLHGLVAATVSGAANGVTVLIVSPDQFNLHAGAGKLSQVFIVGAIIGLAMFLKQSPIPPTEDKPNV